LYVHKWYVTADSLKAYFSSQRSWRGRRYEMDTYKMAELEVNSHGFRFSCTDKQDAEDILTELQHFLPLKVKVESGPDGDQLSWEIGGIRLWSYTKWWIVRQLCLRGWEPFATMWMGEKLAPRSALQFRQRLQG
jgi:hypothetical protein